MNDLTARARTWLAQDVIPLWFKVGVDPSSGAFVESLSRDGEPLSTPRRVMVQARQIYSVAEAHRMGLLSADEAKCLIAAAVEFMIKAYSMPSGAFIHSVDSQGRPAAKQTDLYAQAFALFGLAEAYQLLRDSMLKDRAVALLEYLYLERRLPEGGFAEVVGSAHGYEANPHMHLFEAAIAWMRTDTDPRWTKLAQELAQLCAERFVDAQSGGLCEHFLQGWMPQAEAQGFVWEPGHHYEWAWLLVRYQQVSGGNLGSLPWQLFSTAERQGRDSASGFVYDEVWSSGVVKKASSRFWPQGERVKAAVALGALAPAEDKPIYARAADQALTNLFSYFEGLMPGLWHDTRLQSGEFNSEAQVKASSLYHIINAISEYSNLRSQIAK